MVITLLIYVLPACFYIRVHDEKLLVKFRQIMLTFFVSNNDTLKLPNCQLPAVTPIGPQGTQSACYICHLCVNPMKGIADAHLWSICQICAATYQIRSSEHPIMQYGTTYTSCLSKNPCICVYHPTPKKIPRGGWVFIHFTWRSTKIRVLVCHCHSWILLFHGNTVCNSSSN